MASHSNPVRNIRKIQLSEKDHPCRKSIGVRCSVALLQGYRYIISPLFPPSCRFTPTCSQYAIEAFTRHGVIRGFLLTAWRLLRCHPFAKGGYDPVK